MVTWTSRAILNFQDIAQVANGQINGSIVGAQNTEGYFIITDTGDDAGERIQMQK